jgi:hypothetical protein
MRLNKNRFLRFFCVIICVLQVQFSFGQDKFVLNGNVKDQATGEAIKTEAFTCCICFIKHPLSTLRLIVPCGHGFCVTCTSNLEANITFARRARKQDIPGCYNCRGQVTAVLKAYL